MATKSTATAPAAVARKYAEQVVSGKIVAGRLAQLACKRHLEDLKHGKERGLRFNPERAAHICRFVEGACRHVKGELGGKLIRLEPFQVFSLAVRYGWERYSEEHKRWLRRFHRSYEEEARKQAKSTIKAAESLYMLGTDGEQGAEVYTFATTFPQAEILYAIAQGMVQREPRLESKITVRAQRMVHYNSNSFMAALHAKSRTQDGLNVHAGVADEYHAHKDKGMWNVIESATGARTEYMISAITTAGANLAGPCYEDRDYMTKVLDGVVSDDEQYAMIYALDDEDLKGNNWQDEAVWPKANPALGSFFSYEYLRGKLIKAKQVPADAINFKTKHLNIWVGALKAYYDLAKWNACADPTLRLSDFRGCKCWMSLDLAQVYDCNVILLCFERDGEYYIFPQFYLPEDTVKPRDTEERVKGTGVYRQLYAWAQLRNADGRPYVHLTPGDVVDMDRIEADLAALAAEFSPQEVPYDSYQSTQMVQHLIAQGVPMLQFANSAKFLSQPMKDAAVFMAKKRIHHDGNPVMTWMISNVIGKPVGLDKVYPQKEFDANKIDGPVAMLMCLARAQAANENVYPSGYSLLTA